MTDLLDLGGVWLVEFLLSPEWGLPTVLLTLLLPALGQWLVLRCTRRRFRILRWLTLLPMGVPLLSSLWFPLPLARTGGGVWLPCRSGPLLWPGRYRSLLPVSGRPLSGRLGPGVGAGGRFHPVCSEETFRLPFRGRRTP